MGRSAGRMEKPRRNGTGQGLALWDVTESCGASPATVRLVKAPAGGPPPLPAVLPRSWPEQRSAPEGPCAPPAPDSQSRALHLTLLLPSTPPLFPLQHLFRGH